MGFIVKNRLLLYLLVLFSVSIYGFDSSYQDINRQVKSSRVGLAFSAATLAVGALRTYNIGFDDVAIISFSLSAISGVVLALYQKNLDNRRLSLQRKKQK